MNLLRIDSSPRGARSCSRRLTEQFVQSWSKAHPDGVVVHRDLGLASVPLVSEDWIAAAFSSPGDHTPSQRAAIAVSDVLVGELIAADQIVIGAPMYNFSVTAALKAWIDQVVRVGRTVAYPSYQGLLTGKAATIITTRGGAGMEPGGPMALYDAQVPYLRQILDFIGITDVTVIYASELAGSEAARGTSLEKASAQVETAATR